MRKKTQRRSDCPISFALDIYGDKWSLLIIRDLLFFGKTTYGDFLESKEGISTNILADRLETLESNGIVTKAVDTSNKTKFIYSITDKGIDLLPILVEIMIWSATYDPQTEVPKELTKQIINDQANFIKKTKESLQKKNT